MSSQQRPFAVFDIDGTLIRWQMFHAIVHHLGKEGHIASSTHDQIKAARMEWKRRLTNTGFKPYETLLVKAYVEALTTIDPNAYAQIVDEVFDEYKDQVFVFTRDLIADLKQKGYLLFAISGSQQDIISKLADYHGFDDATGAKLLMKDGKFTGVLDTPIHDKAAALQSLIAKHGATAVDSIGVGDSLSDVAMLERTEQPIAFNPDGELYATAKDRKWQIVVERKNMIYNLKYHDTGYILA